MIKQINILDMMKMEQIAYSLSKSNFALSDQEITLYFNLI
jgi:hypothetical protein